ncbi:MAG: UDP-N-acetylglucosamine 2-epimerase (non-hydrolyzing) [Methanomicrobiales archaeon]|nr:UDP-N-acetylglucosamine 2-epimerase (non-hydrolyzing) [Methanomicrobiales archaeon]MDI6877594.1 UDP-N-acetylglucosamine 2-epimerase (non-hydrolyzing) [Methanomicrobiales archaeon]
MITIVLGTRPEIIKMSPIVRACERRGVDYRVLHTGQHYSPEMDRIFFDELELPQPAVNLGVGSASHAVQTGRIMGGVEEVLLRERADAVLVQGDTNTVLAASLAAAKLHIPVGHVEAGLRSFDRRMPEEINRVVADHVADLLFAPTKTARRHLLAEGIPDARIAVVGNTIVDAVRQNREIADRRVRALESLGLERGGYILTTAHREENVDERARLEGILTGLRDVQRTVGMPVVFPVHPRTTSRMRQFGIEAGGIRAIPPLGFLEFLQLEANARLVLTDSGGVQEEACILGVPCVTLRENTERPETVDVGANMLGGTDPRRILAAAEEMLARRRGWENPFGDGQAGERILDRTLLL